MINIGRVMFNDGGIQVRSEKSRDDISSNGYNSVTLVAGLLAVRLSCPPLPPLFLSFFSLFLSIDAFHPRTLETADTFVQFPDVAGIIIF